MSKPCIKNFYFPYEPKLIDDNTINFMMGTSDSTRLRLECDENVLYLLSLCNGKNEIDFIIQSMSSKGMKEETTKQMIGKFFDAGILNKENLISVYKDKYDMERFSRQFSFFQILGNEEEVVKWTNKISQKKVLLVGMGGIGCWVLANLVSCGILNFSGIDGDIIEKSNLSRQILYTEADIGRYKVDVAKEWIHNFNHNIKFEPIVKTVDSTIDILDAIEKFNIDFIVLSADYPFEILKYTHEACSIKKIPYIQAGYTDETGICGPLVDNYSINILDTIAHDKTEHKIYDDLLKKIGEQYITPVLCPVVAMVSSYASLQIIKYITGIGEVEALNTRLKFDFITGKIIKERLDMGVNENKS